MNALRALSLLCLGALALVAPARAQTTRLLDASSVTTRDDHQDLAIEFGCSLRYQSHSPASEGDELHVTLALGPDCGLSPTAQFPVDRLLPVEGRELVRSIELQPGLSGGAELVIRWNRIQKFVLAPSAGMRGLRVRVPRRVTSQVLVPDTPQLPGRYAVNLESSTSPFDETAVAKAAALLGSAIYVSLAEVDGQRWYRLRAGPFDSRRDADRVLRAAQSRYASAWLGIEDEPPSEALEEDELSLPMTAEPRAPENRADPQLDQLLAESRTAMARRRPGEATVLLTRIIAAEDYVHRVQAAEMLGIARERQGQLAQAKSTYEDFLRRYPDAEAAGRVRQKLQSLRTASLPGRRGSGGGAGREGWSAFGSASQVYRRDDSQLSNTALSRSIVTQNALISDFDSVVRHRGERYLLTSRANFGYLKDLLSAGPGDQLRVSSAFVELQDRERGAGARFGRQSRGMAGLPGTFDGMLGNWQWRPSLGLNIAAGMPVESSRRSPETDRRFFAMAADFATRDHHWDTSVYALTQQYAGTTDRRSLGIETRYLRPGRTLFALADYDVYFAEINSLMLLGTLVTDSRWTFNIDLSRQRSPMLSIRNALIGQPTLVFDDLALQFSDAEIEQLALDRSAQLTQFSLSASHPLGERAQWSLNLLSSDFSGQPASGGVEALLAPGRDNSATSEILVNSLFRAGDAHSVALRYQTGETGTLMSAGIGSRLPMGSALRLTSRLRVEHRSLESDDSRQWTYVPSMRLDYVRGRGIVELEAGAELGQRARSGSSENTTRYFFSLGYRLSLDWGLR